MATLKGFTLVDNMNRITWYSAHFCGKQTTRRPGTRKFRLPYR